MTDASLLDDPDVSSEYRDVNGVRLHVVAAGEEDAPLVVLLHGAPEFWYGWHRQIEPLVEAGYRVLVPDQRGYNLSEQPEGTRSYRIDELSADVAALVESTGRESAHVVGHDWGGAVAWDLALRRPEVVDRVGVLNSPHPTAFQETLTSSLRQARSCWHVFFFQLPRLPEWYARRNEFQWLADVLGSARDGAFTEADVERYRASWAAGSPTGMINWYRALLRHPQEPPRERVEAPTLLLWGEADRFFLPKLAPESVAYCDDGRLERLPQATHWLHHEQPERIAELLVDHLEA